MDQPTSSFDFELVAQSPGCANGTDYDVISYFPWAFNDYKKFSESRGVDWRNPNVVGVWHGVVKKWTGVAAICGRNSKENMVRFVRTTPQKPLQFLHQLEVATGTKEILGFRCICWSFDPKTLAPLVLLGGMSGNITVYSPSTKTIFSVLRGHGGRVTSLATHPRNPSIFASTSRDKTTRLWSLDLPSEMKIVSEDPDFNRLGPMFGAPLTAGENEGMGPGRCFAVTVGGASEGHNATVSDASFHSEFNILATSSVDHQIKLWSFDPPPLPTAKDGTLVNLMRPIFSSKGLHPAMVFSVHWLSPSLLVSQSSQSQTTARDPFPAKIAIWKWLGYESYRTAASRGYQYVKDSLNATDSHSYKILADVPLYYPSQKLSFSRNLAILTSRSHTRVLDPSRFEPRVRPGGPEEAALTEADLHLDDADAWTEVLDEKKRWLLDHAASESETPASMGAMATIPLEDVEEDTVFNAAMSHGMLLRVGNKERLRVWRLKPTSLPDRNREIWL